MLWYPSNLNYALKKHRKLFREGEESRNNRSNPTFP